MVITTSIVKLRRSVGRLVNSNSVDPSLANISNHLDLLRLVLNSNRVNLKLDLNLLLNLRLLVLKRQVNPRLVKKNLLNQRSFKKNLLNPRLVKRNLLNPKLVKKNHLNLSSGLNNVLPLLLGRYCIRFRSLATVKMILRS